MTQVTYAVAIHGGAGDLPLLASHAQRDQYRASLARALELGRDHLQRGDSSLDKVEAVIHILEDDPKFNAAVTALVSALHSESPPATAERIVWALGKIGPRADQARETLKNLAGSDSRLARTAARALEQLQ